MDAKPRLTRPAFGCACCSGAMNGGGHSRRAVLRSGFGVIAATAAGSTGAPRPAAAQTTLSPDAALQTLVDGNRRFYEHRLTSFDEDLAILKERTAEKQEPYAGILSCADSRVPVELIFDQTIGHLFVTRVAGNTAGSTVTASLEYGAAVLGTKVILVLGHANCGAVKAAMYNKPVPGQISRLFAALQPAVTEAHGDLTEAIKANARIQARLLATSSPVLAGLIKSGNLKIAAGYYALDTGIVTILG
ncbi:carbonic anhydrase [Acidisoma sp.]|uniref:carbonic anhydrase n=1 Tax=Acidisoma sp. TaxID=1872115 RepID=UPI003B00BFF2